MKSWLIEPAKKIDADMINSAKEYQKTLTKPLGSLGELEAIAEKFSGWQSSLHPCIESISIRVFAGDHGVYNQGVSAFPQDVTVKMVSNFLAGGAAISVLARDLEADFKVVNTGTVSQVYPDNMSQSRLINTPVAEGTQDFSREPAMSSEQLDEALEIGKNVINEVTADLFIGGEMGIANTTSASAIYSALLSLSPEQTVGSGTGIDKEALERKKEIIKKALVLHKNNLVSPYNILQCFGGFEIAALTGSFIACAQRGIPVLVDGFICTAAALLAVEINKSIGGWLLYSHRSAEPAHELALNALEAKPLLDLGLRLGEASGAAVAVPLLMNALLLHNNMATFSQLGIKK